MAKKVSLWDAHCRRFWVLNTLYNRIMDGVVKVYDKGEPELEQWLRDLAGQVYEKIREENKRRPRVDE